MSEPEAIDRIYESAFVPEQWPNALEDLRARSNGVSVSLFVGKGDNIRCTASPFAESFTERFVREGWFWRGQIVKRMFASKRPGFLRDVELLDERELDEEPIYRDLWRPKFKVGWGMGTAIRLPTEDYVCFVATRLMELGPFEVEAQRELDGLRPHLARAVLISARLQLDRARAASETLAHLGLPALVLDARGKVLAANDLLAGLSRVVQWRAMDQVALSDPNADRLLREALAAIDVDGASSPRSFPAREAETGVLRVAHLIPIRRAARDIFLRCAAILILTPTTAPKAPPVDLVRSLFDLTPAEASAACRLAEGKSIEGIAAEKSLSVNTIRTHVKGVMDKTGLHRQGEVIALLGGLSPIRSE